MAELGVSDEQFVEACQKAEANPIHKKIVDQIMAVDSFLAFKRLMVKRNQELNRQAVEMYEKLSKQNSEKTDTPSSTADKTSVGKEGEEAKDASKAAATATNSNVGPDGQPLTEE